jgi:hypothetical protein
MQRIGSEGREAGHQRERLRRLAWYAGPDGEAGAYHNTFPAGVEWLTSRAFLSDSASRACRSDVEDLVQGIRG